MSSVIDPAPAPAAVPAPADGPAVALPPVVPPRRRRAPRWLAPALAAVLAAAAAACGLGATHAATRAAEVESWDYTTGVVVAHPHDDERGPGVVYYDEDGRQRVLWLAPLDTADIPPGAITTVAYQRHGRGQEFRFLPRQQEHAWLWLLSVTGGAAVLIGGWAGYDLRRRRRAPRPELAEPVVATGV